MELTTGAGAPANHGTLRNMCIGIIGEPSQTAYRID